MVSSLFTFYDSLIVLIVPVVHFVHVVIPYHFFPFFATKKETANKLSPRFVSYGLKSVLGRRSFDAAVDGLAQDDTERTQGAANTGDGSLCTLLLTGFT